MLTEAQLPEDLQEIRLETEALEVGDFPNNEDMATLCRYVRHRQRLESEAERIKEQMQLMLNTLRSRLEGLDYVYMPLVEPIVRRMLAGQKIKSIKTPWGTAGYRTLQPKLEIRDEAALLNSAMANEKLSAIVRIPPPEISKSKLNEYFEKTGDMPDGVELIPAHEKFFCK